MLKPLVFFLDAVEFQAVYAPARAARHEINDLAYFSAVDDGHALEVVYCWRHCKLPANPLHIASFG